jgi:hypothetical protein
MHISFVDQARGAWKDGRKLTVFSLNYLNFIKFIYGIRRAALVGNFDKLLPNLRNQSCSFSPPRNRLSPSLYK